jgi:UDP-N-acetylmuramoylalanine--D-glutamate ligase
MAIPTFLQGKIVAVMGLGKSGVATARALEAAGAEVWAWDDKEAARAAAQAQGIPLCDLTTASLARAALMVWSPGIPSTYPSPHPIAERARAAGLRLVCDIELLARACPAARFVAVTGTNGKSTTTALIGHILKVAGVRVEIGGNLGIPALSLPPLGAGGTYVLEISSYQAELLDSARFDAVALLNITPDHLGRHGGMTGYVEAKAGLFTRLKPNGTAVIGVDDAECQALFDRLCESSDVRTVPVSIQSPVAGGVAAPDGLLLDGTGGQAHEGVDLTSIPTLPGAHNWQNACVAFAVARALGVPSADIDSGLYSFDGLAHRQETIAEVDGIRFVNDSKATNADAVARALVCYDGIYWILGGQAKEGGIVSLEPLFPRVRRAFLIGEATEAFAASLAGKVDFDKCGTLEVAVTRAFAAAKADGARNAVVLLSPACASWDQFSSFEHRGDVFRQLVAALPRSAP